MKTKCLSAFLVSLLIVTIFMNQGFLCAQVTEEASPDVYVGVDVAYDNVTAIKQIVDEVSSYTNLFVIGCTGITRNDTKLNETAQYVYDKNMSFIIYRDTPPSARLLEEAKEWGDRFLGFYAYDEPGGRQLDLAQGFTAVTSADNFTDAAAQFVKNTNMYLRSSPWAFTRNYANSTDFPLFTSDYALYWFDYKSGYDTLFAEFGWNYSRQLNVALCRGAAAVQNKEWGVIISWTYTEPPYIESGEELYKDLVLAHENGAKYIVILDTDKEYIQGILKEEHLQALEQFWQYAQTNPRYSNPISDRVAFVLPKDYAYGFRGPNDKIWGLWEADALSLELSKNINALLEEYGDTLDIIYDDGLAPGNNYGYSQLLYWNDTSLQPTPSPSPTPSPTPSQSPSPTPSPSPSSSPTPSPSPTSSLSPPPTPQSTASPDPPTGFFLPTEYIYAIVVGVAAAVVVATVLVLRKRR